MFLDVLGDHIKWNTRVASISKVQGSGYELAFGDDTSQAFDLVIGADGCFPTIRPAVTPVHPGYTGITFCEMYMIDAVKDHPDAAATIGTGSVITSATAMGYSPRRIAMARFVFTL
jgi:2-polyprenyl-6-methoxyphenol hydroxylase-like FAD-dependent oxidoreductase